MSQASLHIHFTLSVSSDTLALISRHVMRPHRVHRGCCRGLDNLKTTIKVIDVMDVMDVIELMGDG